MFNSPTFYLFQEDFSHLFDMKFTHLTIGNRSVCRACSKACRQRLAFVASTQHLTTTFQWLLHYHCLKGNATVALHGDVGAMPMAHRVMFPLYDLLFLDCVYFEAFFALFHSRHSSLFFPSATERRRKGLVAMFNTLVNAPFGLLLRRCQLYI